MWYFSDTATMKPDRIQQRDSKSERAAINKSLQRQCIIK